MKTSLITRDEMIEAIEQHTCCIATKEIPSVVVNYLMVTKRLYARKDKNALKRILLTDVREYLVEQGRIPYAEVAAEKRKEAKMQTEEQPTVPKVISPVMYQGDIDSQQLLKMVNDARKLCAEKPVRNNDFIARIRDELDGEGYEIFVTPMDQVKGGANQTVIVMSHKQALRVAARESKAVRRSLIDKLEELQQREQASPTPAIPQSLPEALRLAAELAEQKQHLEEQLQSAAPKVDFADRVAAANGILISNYAKAISMKPNTLFAWLRENNILIAYGSRKNVPLQRYINQGFFSVKEVVLEGEEGYKIRLTPHITGKGQQWLTKKLLDAGLLKPIARS
ncbi:phage antirepressor KilAC domain-containing protein [Citrobacter braakii]|uniref:phage antirepressor KilAC domain-containing protein n=1 Tax=Citrobacter braakii TaxID=57706 RepID=UPI00066A2C7D|nr:phage antirepressor KilAC domain-containing protein [Citrobacter braakii]EFG0523301.1 phage antirepressor Ant [Escherichia coli]